MVVMMSILRFNCNIRSSRESLLDFARSYLFCGEVRSQFLTDRFLCQLLLIKGLDQTKPHSVFLTLLTCLTPTQMNLTLISVMFHLKTLQFLLFR